MAQVAQEAGATASSQQALGQLIGTYGKSRSFLFVGWFLALLFGGIGLFVLWFAHSMSTNTNPNVHFDGDLSLVYKVGVGGVVVGVAIAVLIWRLAAAEATFHLHENGIRAVKGGVQNVVLYRDLEDLFRFFYGGIAYRAAPGTPWQFFASRIHKYGELSHRLIELQIAHRGPLLADRLDAGQPVVFRYFDDSVGKTKSLVAATRNMNYPTHDIVLTRDRLQIGQDSIALDRIQGINTNLWTESSKIVDVDGRVFFKIHPSSILSFDLLHALIARQQEAG